MLLSDIMVDFRFHRFAGPAKVGNILTALGRGDLLAGLSDPDFLIEGVTDVDLAGRGDLVLAAHASYAEQLRATAAGLVIVLPALAEAVPEGTLALVSDKPHHLFADILDFLFPASTRSVMSGGRDDLGEPFLEEGVVLGANVVLGQGVEIGRGTLIGANTVIGAGVTIGRNTTIAANCTIDCAHIGNEVVIHSGTRIGAEGFGWLDFGTSKPQAAAAGVRADPEQGGNRRQFND